jgi:hypothetical protein
VDTLAPNVAFPCEGPQLQAWQDVVHLQSRRLARQQTQKSRRLRECRESLPSTTAATRGKIWVKSMLKKNQMKQAFQHR